MNEKVEKEAVLDAIDLQVEAYERGYRIGVFNRPKLLDAAREEATQAEQKRLNGLAELATLAERKRILSQLVLAPCEEPGKGKSSRKKFYHLTKKEFAALNPQDDE